VGVIIAISRREELQALYNIHLTKEKKIVTAAQIKASEEVPKNTVPMKTAPYKHQEKALAFSKVLDSSALLLEQGCGKTWVAIALAGYRRYTGQIKRLLIIAPATVLPVWERQFHEHANFNFAITILNTDSTAEKAKIVKSMQKDNLSKCLDIIIVNYESAWREPLRSQLLKWIDGHMVVLDESQKIKHHTSKQSKFAHALGKVAKYRNILTGTPVTLNPTDVFSQYKFLDTDVFGTSWTQFRDTYCIMGGFGNHQVVGYKNLSELASRAHSIAFRCTKAECLDLPEVIHQTQYAYLSDSQSVYREMEKNFMVWIKDQESQGVDIKIKAPQVVSQILRLQQISGGFLPVHNAEGKVINYVQVGHEKLDLLMDVVNEIPDQKIVVFCRFTHEVHAIAQALKESGRKTLVLNGEVPINQRGVICDSFQTDPSVKAIVVQIQTGGSGIDLFAASTMIFYSMDYNYGNYAQAHDRILRIGQKASHVTYIHLVAHGTIDEQILKAVTTKEDVARLVVDELKGEYAKN
jgi:SNF2 family DNA or RNA helicase